MVEPSIPEVSSGQVIASSWGNTVRTKVQDTTDGHRHDGSGSRILEGTKIKDVDASPVDDMLLKVLDAILYLRSSADDADRQIALACVPNIDDAHIPDLETLSYGAAFAVAQIPDLPASKVTSGTFDLARIPTMDDAHIPHLETLDYGGAFAVAQIPTLSIAKISDIPGTIASILTDHNLAQHHGLFLGIDSNGKLVLTQIGTKAGDLATLWDKTTKIITADIDSGEFNVANKLVKLDVNADVPDAQIPNLPASKITSGTFDLARIPTMDDGHVPDLETLSYGAAFAVAQIPNLPASKITSEILAAARGGLGKALNPTYTDDYILVYKSTPDEFQMEAKGAPSAHESTHVAGGTDEIDSALALAAIPNLPASRITSGVFDLARIPNMDDAHIPDLETLGYGGAFANAQIPDLASKVLSECLVKDEDATPVTNVLLKVIDGVLRLRNSGDTAFQTLVLDSIPTMDDAHIPDVETLSYGAAFADAQIPNLAASKITSGVFDLARIPNMDDAHVPDLETLSYGAAFAVAQIPNLPASKITSEILAVARGGLGKALNPTYTDDYILVYKSTPDEFQMEAKGTPGAHKDTHKSGGTDAFVLADVLDCLARLEVKKAGSSIGKRRGLNLIEGSNVTLTIADDATNEEVDVTIAASGGDGDPLSKTVMRPYKWTQGGDSGGGVQVAFWTGHVYTASTSGYKYWWGWKIPDNVHNYLAIFDKNPIFETHFRLDSVADCDRWFILGKANNTTEPANTDKLFGVHVANAALKLISADGTTLSESASLMTLSAETWYHIKVALVSGTKIEVWIDGTSKGTKTTNLPSGSFKSSTDTLMILVKTNAASSKGVGARLPRLQHDN